MKTLVCLGDSLTGPAPGASYHDKYLKWSDLLQVALDAVLGEGAARVLNQGQAGETSAGLLAALDERLIRHRADGVVLMIGANNFSRCADLSAALAAFEADLASIVRRALEASVRVLLLQYPRPFAEDMSRVWTHADAGNGVIARVAAEHDVALLDLAPPFARAAGEQPPAALLNPVDGIHLNPGGELIVARAVSARLRELGWLAVG